MAKIIGTITKESGSFYIKHADGSISSAKVGDVIKEGDTLLGSDANSAGNIAQISLADGSGFVELAGANEQLFDATMLSDEIIEDTVVDNSDLLDESLLDQAVNNTQNNNLANVDNTTLADIENLPAAAAGAGEPTTDGTGTLVARLEDRTGDETNVTTDLRDSTTTQTDVIDTTVGDTVVAEPIDAILTLSNVNVNEGVGSATISGSLNYAPLTPLVITLSNGSTMTFGTGYVPGTLVLSTPFDIQGDDVYKDPESYDVTGTSFVGGGFNSISSNASTVSVNDTETPVTVSLSATASITEDGTSITYTATLDNPAETDVTVTLSNGETITILAEGTDLGNGQTADGLSGSVDHTVTADEDVYTDPTSVSATISNATGGNFENLVIESDTNGDPIPAVTSITDTIDDTTVSLSATASITEAGTSITYTATLDNPAETDVTVTLSNGETITILAEGTDLGNGQTADGLSGSVDHTVTADEDVYTDPTSVSATISNATGGNFENLVIESDTNGDPIPAVTSITDTIDDTTARITVNIENSSTATVSVVLSNSPDSTTFDSDNPPVVFVKPDNSTTLLEIPIDNQGEGSITVNDISAFVGDNGELTVSYDHIVGGNYENVVGISGTDYMPVVTTSGTATVSEEGLVGGMPDETPAETDTTNAVTDDSILLSFSNFNGTPSISGLIYTGPALTSGNEAVTWTPTDTTSGYQLVGSTSTGDVMTVIVNDDGTTSVTLNGAIDHLDDSREDIQNLSFRVDASDGSVSAYSNFTVSVEDDSPYVSASGQTVEIESSGQSTFNANVMLTLDYSGSMGSNDIYDMESASINLLNVLQTTLNDAGSGDVKVMIVKFASSADASGWLSISDAIEVINNGNPESIGIWTNYDAALNDLMTSFNTSTGAVTANGTVNLSYFMSDGDPTTNNGGDNGITSNGTGDEVSQNEWETFLEENNIISYALGMGSNVSSVNLEPIAYNGVTSQDEHDILLMPSVDFNQLSSVLVANVPDPDPIEGSLFTNVSTGTVDYGFGGDGGHLTSISINGTTYTYDGTEISNNSDSNTINGSSLVVTTTIGGSFTVDMDTGIYNYQPNSTNDTAGQQEIIGFSLIDADGDTATSSLIIDIVGSPASAPELTISVIETIVNNVEPDVSLFTSLGSLDEITVTGVPSGATLSAGTDNGDGTWTLVKTDLDGLELHQASGSEVNATLNFSATSSGTLASDDFNSGTDGWDGDGNGSNSEIWLKNKDDAMSKTFDFGTERAGETVTVTFDYRVDGGWDNSGDKIDYYFVTGNSLTSGLLLANQNSYTGTFTLDENGKLNLTVQIDATGSSENFYFDSVVISSSAPSQNISDSVNVDLAVNTSLIVDIDINTSLTDATETLSDITLSGLPTDGVLTSDSGSYTISGGVATIPVLELNGLSLETTMTSPFQLQATVTSTETDASADTATAYGLVNVNGVVDGQTLIGSNGDDILSGSDGGDTIDGGAGADEIYGGAGNDTIVYDSNDTVIDGGTGIDTLVLSGDGDSIDFGNVGNLATQTITSIEKIDLTASGSQTISNLSLSDVLDTELTGADITSSGNINSTDKLVLINGDSQGNDSVSLTNDFTKLFVQDSEGQNTTTALTTTIDNVEYNIYSANDDTTTYKVLVQTEINDNIS